MLNTNLTRKEELERIAHHELGHWLMSKELGFPVGNIRVAHDNHGTPYGSSRVYPFPKKKLETVEDVNEHLLNRICVLFAGVISDIAWHKKFHSHNFNQADIEYLLNHGPLDETGLSDKGKIEELMYVVNGIVNFPVEIVEGFEEKIKNQQKDILNKAWVKSSNFIENNEDLFKMGKALIEKIIKNNKTEFEMTYLLGLQKEVAKQ